jgi:hypothetical protein
MSSANDTDMTRDNRTAAGAVKPSNVSSAAKVMNQS